MRSVEGTVWLFVGSKIVMCVLGGEVYPLLLNDGRFVEADFASPAYLLRKHEAIAYNSFPPSSRVDPLSLIALSSEDR